MIFQGELIIALFIYFFIFLDKPMTWILYKITVLISTDITIKILLQSADGEGATDH